ncbi:MAG: hypothetical protein LJE67_09760 [Salaquimonas sp.]|nr:hypothetical protein [Salaquimonas sp.]
MKLLRVLLPVSMAAAAVLAPCAFADDASQTRIGKLLAGNSIIHPNFGCAYYRPDGTMTQYGRSGQTIEGKWQVRGDTYFSSGQCGREGCQITGQYPNFTFRRLDGEYSQPVILIRGNYCEKNGIFS